MTMKFLSEIPPDGTRPELEPVEGGHYAAGFATLVPSDTVKAKLAAALRDMASYLNSIEDANGPFQLDEAEMTFQVDQSGEINIILGKLGGNLSGGIRFKWKRRKVNKRTNAPGKQ